MARAKKSEVIQGTEKEFLDIFNRLCYSRSSWQVWADVISAIACSLSNATDRSPKHFEQREKEYAQCIERLGSVEAPAKILGTIVMALENDPEQDFLGKMYMNLNLGNHWKGQFFTPYRICKMMSQLTVVDIDRQIEEQGYISVCDPACGAGATLIAAANTMKNSKYNFQNHVIFVGQDVDRVVAQMCYIQLSLLGCAGYICVGIEELKIEGEALHHCVGAYSEKVRKGETMIFFIRLAAEPEKPFYTLEWKGKVVQCRGFKNCDMTPEVNDFVDIFEKKMQEYESMPGKKHRKAG